MKTVYSLREDEAAVASLQAASLSSGPIGLRRTHGLVGSTEWWAAIADGRLRLTRVEGTISGFWPGQGRQGPAEFELRTSERESTRWLCGLDPRVAAQIFSFGRNCAVEFVEQELKTAYEGTTRTKLTVRILIAEGDRDAA